MGLMIYWRTNPVEGSVFTLDGTKKTLFGYWWYDYPDDVFENPDDAGIGKLFMYVTDQMCTLKLESQEAKKLVIKSRFRTWFLDRKGPMRRS